MNGDELHGTILEYTQGLYPEGEAPELMDISMCISFMGAEEPKEGETETRVMGGSLLIDPAVPDGAIDEEIINGGTIQQIATMLLSSHMKQIQAACTQRAHQLKDQAQGKQS